MKLFGLKLLHCSWFQILIFLGTFSYFSIDCPASSAAKSEENDVSTVCIYSTSFVGSECILSNLDMTKILNESRHSDWAYRMLLPVTVQAKENISLPANKTLKVGKKITIACHLNDHKDLSHCEGKDYIKLPKGFEPLQQHTVVLHLVQALKPDTKNLTDIKTFIENLNEIKLSEDWIQKQFKPVDESEQIKS